MKRIFLILIALLISAPCYALDLFGHQQLAMSAAGGMMMAGGEPSSASCSPWNQVLDQNTNSATSANEGTSPYWFAAQFTTATTKTITGGYWYVWTTNGSYPVSCTYEIHSDSSGSPGSIVGAGYTVTRSISDASETLEPFQFATPQTLPAGTYWRWLYCAPSGGGSAFVMQYTFSGTGTHKSSANGTSWSSSSNSKWCGTYGC